MILIKDQLVTITINGLIVTDGKKPLMLFPNGEEKQNDEDN